ncbi:hypothetical protein [Streptomyces sp. NPDC005890]|uniref:hypothetical protein n=1 Tax=Streptomyces sp. NPDC005890 TaxID=3154568 RepID=UPI003407698A
MVARARNLTSRRHVGLRRQRTATCHRPGWGRAPAASDRRRTSASVVLRSVLEHGPVARSTSIEGDASPYTPVAA